MHTNGGSQFFNQMGVLTLIPIEVHYEKYSMENIIALKDIASVQGVQVTMDTDKERAMIVHYKGEDYKFREFSSGLYVYNMNVPSKTKSTVKKYSLSCLNMVAENKKHFTVAEIKGAEVS